MEVSTYILPLEEPLLGLTVDIGYRFSVRLHVNPAAQQTWRTVEDFLVDSSLVGVRTISPPSPEKRGKRCFQTPASEQTIFLWL